MIKPKRVLVVGGGSSGWMAAAYLNAVLNHDGAKTADISLVESPDVPRIGVGEATVPNINHILAVIGIDENEFMKRVDGTFKQSIRYVNWLHGKGDYYHHPFSRFRPAPVDWSGQNWLMSDRSIPFTETVSAQPIICELGRAPKPVGQSEIGTPLTYAFHMNALKFADYLCELSTARGVSHHLDHVVDVEMAENGNIAAVHTRGGQRLEADLFIDCTGFAALLIEKKLGVGWSDCSQWLLCDRAVTMHVPYEHHYPGYVRPYTTATALSAGWIWEIPLQDKRSLGYVHSSAFLNDEDAEREIRRVRGQACRIARVSCRAFQGWASRKSVGCELYCSRSCGQLYRAFGVHRPVSKRSGYDHAELRIFPTRTTTKQWPFVSTESWSIVFTKSWISSTCITV